MCRLTLFLLAEQRRQSVDLRGRRKRKKKKGRQHQVKSTQGETQKSYGFFPIHGLHPQSPVGLRERLQSDDAVSAPREKGALDPRRGGNEQPVSLPLPLHHFNVKAEALVDGVRLPSHA